MSTLNCPNPPVQPKLKQFPGSAVAARLRGHYDEIAQRAGVLAPAQDIEMRLQREFAVRAVSAAHIPLLKNFNKLESTLAKELGWKSWAWQAVTRGMTNAGEVRYALQDRAKLAVNLIQSVATYKILPDLRSMYRELQTALPNLPESKLQEILYDQVVIGQYPRLQNILDSPLVHDQLLARYNQHMQRLSSLGVSAEAIATLDRLAGKISQAFDTLRALAAREGLDIPVLKNGGYFPLRVQEEARRYINELAATSGVGKANPFADLDGFFMKTRQTNVPLVVKPGELGYLLGNVSEQEIINMAVQPGKLSEYLNSKFSPDQIEKLFESGVLVQAPALSDELTEFFESALDLPIENLGQAIVLNPVKAVQDYTKQLKEVVRKSSMIKDLFTEGVANGWIIDGSMLAGRNSRDYVRLGSSQLLMDALPSTDLREEVANMFIHRTVADQLNALLAINQSWADLGILGQTVQRVIQPFTSVFRRMALLGAPIGYLKRVITQDLVAVYAATGSLAHVGIATAEVARYLAKNSIKDIFSKPIPIKIGSKYYDLSELFEATFLKRGGDFVTATGEQLDRTRYFKHVNPESFQRFMMFNKAHAAKFGSPFTGKILSAVELVKEMVSDTFQGSYAALAMLNQYIDFIGRWAAVRTLAFEQGGRFADIDDLIRYTDDYFQINEDVGAFGKLYNSIGMPFASFAMAAPGSAIRFTLQHPWRAGRMLTLYAQAASGNNLTDAEMAQWQKDNYVVSVATDPITGKQYGVLPTSVDFYLSSYVWFRELAEDLARAAGVPVGSVKEQVEQEKDPGKPLVDALQGMIQDTYLSALFPLFGIDPNTLRELENPEQQDTLLGLPISRRYRDAVVRALPLMKALDEKLLPPSIVGQARKVNPSTLRVEQEGEAGWLGFTPSYGGKRERYIPTKLDVAWLLNNFAGLTLSEIDPGRNLINNYNDFQSIQNELKATADKLSRRIFTEQDSMQPAQLEALKQQRQAVMRLWFALEYNKYLIDRVADQRGLPRAKVMNQLQQKMGSFVAPEKLQYAEEFVNHYYRELWQQP